MNLPLIDGAMLVGRLAQIAQFKGTHDSKTDQTAQTDQRIENAWKFGAPLDQKPTSRQPKLTSGTVQQPDPRIQVVDAPAHSTHACANEGAAHP